MGNSGSCSELSQYTKLLQTLRGGGGGGGGGETEVAVLSYLVNGPE